MNTDIAVMSDIHGNYVAFEECLNYALSRGIRTFFFLGDYIGELAYPERTMQLLYEVADRYECYFIKGNKEDYWLQYRVNGEQGWKDNHSTTGALLYAYRSLTARDLNFFADLLSLRTLTVDEMPSITLCHGTPDRMNGKMLPEDDKTSEIMNRTQTPVILCGHTHIQGKIIHQEKCVLNPGSVGLPYYSNGKSQFLLLHGNDGVWSEEFISLSYDVDRVIKDLQDAKLKEHAPYWSLITESVLRGSNISHGDILSSAMELCRQETGACIWPNVPEEFWARAVYDANL